MIVIERRLDVVEHASLGRRTGAVLSGTSWHAEKLVISRASRGTSLAA
jgi:hypothetical protein